MKYAFYIVIGLAVVLLSFGIFNREQPQPSNDRQTKQWETKTDNQPPITIKVTPIELGQNVKIWKFTLVFETHSGSLDQDPAKVASLVDDKGNAYRPISWEGPGPGGHHREGTLIFNPILPLPKYVELKIRDVGGVSERLFRWNME